MERDAGGTPLHDDLGWMVGVVFRSYVDAADQVLAELPGGPRGYQVLSAACAARPRNQGAIAEDLGIDRTVMTYLVDDLERLGLVVRRPDAADRRSRLVVATDAGVAARESRRDALRQVEDLLLQPLSGAEAATFRTLLRTLACAGRPVEHVEEMCRIVERLEPDRQHTGTA